MIKKDEEKITELDVARRLSRKYPAPAWAFLTRVRRGTGYSTVIRTADAIAMSLFPSRGFEIHGFEIKVSKNDWKKELNDPYKSIELQNFCHRWWVVVPEKEIIVLSEVPQNWGVIIAKKNGNSIFKDAPLLKADPIDYPFLGAIFRNLNENFIHKDYVKEEIENKKKQWEEYNSYELKNAKKILEKLKEFENISGVKIDTFSGEHHKKSAEMLKLIMEFEGDIKWRFEDLYRHANKIIESFKKMEEGMKGVIKITEKNENPI